MAPPGLDQPCRLPGAWPRQVPPPPRASAAPLVDEANEAGSEACVLRGHGRVGHSSRALCPWHWRVPLLLKEGHVLLLGKMGQNKT